MMEHNQPRCKMIILSMLLQRVTCEHVPFPLLTVLSGVEWMYSKVAAELFLSTTTFL